MLISTAYPEYIYQWLLQMATTTRECPISLKSFRTHSQIDHSYLKWRRTTSLYGSLEIVLLDGVLVWEHEKLVFR